MIGYDERDAIKDQRALLLERRVDIAIDKLYNEDVYKVNDLQTFKIPKHIVRDMVDAIYTPRQKYVVLFSIEIIHELLFKRNIRPENIYFVSGSDIKGRKFSELGIVNYFVLPKDTVENTVFAMKKWIKDMTTSIMDNVTVIGNPPYNGDGKKQTLYDKFFTGAVELNPKTICMIIPSSWFIAGSKRGGSGSSMYNKYIDDRKFKQIQHFNNSADVFEDTNIPNGVNWFVWSSDYNGDCMFNGELRRIRDVSAYMDDKVIQDILKKVFNKTKSNKVGDTMYRQFPYMVQSNDENFVEPDKALQSVDYLPVYMTDKKKGRRYVLIDKEYVLKQLNARRDANDVVDRIGSIDHYKVCISKACGEVKHSGVPFILSPGEICSRTFFVMFHSKSVDECKNFITYMMTKIFQFLVSLKKISHNMSADTFSLIPNVDYSHAQSDCSLSEFFELSDVELEYIDKCIADDTDMSAFVNTKMKSVANNVGKSVLSYKCESAL